MANGTNGATEWLIYGTYLPNLNQEHYTAYSMSITGRFEYYLSVFITGEKGLTDITCENMCGHATAYLCIHRIDLQTNGKFEWSLDSQGLGPV